MGWSFRKSLSFGGFRLNFSQKGMGVSVGTRGFRYGVTATGRQYIRCGAGGIYYQKTLNPVPNSRTTQPSAPTPVTGGQPTAIESQRAETIVDSNSAYFVKEIQNRLNTPRWHVGIAIMSTAAFATSFLLSQPIVSLLILVAGIPSSIVGYRRYLAQSKMDVQYDLEPGFAHRYQQLVNSIASLQRAQRLWVIKTTSTVADRRYHAGASNVLTRQATYATLIQPRFLLCNIVPPALGAGRQVLYFLPDVVLVVEGRQVGAVTYDNLSVTSVIEEFIEDEVPPTDAKQVSATWQYVNKNGTPDRRFANNRQLPVMQYGRFALRSASGLHEEFYVSASGCARTLADSLRVMIIAPSCRHPHPRSSVVYSYP